MASPYCSKFQEQICVFERPHCPIAGKIILIILVGTGRHFVYCIWLWFGSNIMSVATINNVCTLHEFQWKLFFWRKWVLVDNIILIKIIWVWSINNFKLALALSPIWTDFWWLERCPHKFHIGIFYDLHAHQNLSLKFTFSHVTFIIFVAFIYYYLYMFLQIVCMCQCKLFTTRFKSFWPSWIVWMCLFKCPACENDSSQNPHL